MTGGPHGGPLFHVGSLCGMWIAIVGSGSVQKEHA